MGKKIGFSKGLKLQAKTNLAEKNKSLKLAVLFIFIITQVVYAISFCFSYFTVMKNGESLVTNDQLNSKFWIYYGVSLFLSLFIQAFYAASNFSLIKSVNATLKENQSQTFKSFFLNYNSWFKAFRAYIWKIFFIMLWEILGILITFGILALFFGLEKICHFSLNETAEIVLTFCLLYGIMIPLLLIKSIQYSMQFIILSDVNIGVCKAMDLSVALMKGYKWKYFCFVLSFIGHWILQFITFGIYGIWFIPYYCAAKINFYNYIKSNPRDKLTKKQNKLIAEYGTFTEQGK